MNNGGFTLLWSKTLGSSIWLESAETRIVWFTLMMLKDKDGFVRGGSIAALAHIARVTPEECQTAMDLFLAPDKGSSTPDEEGRRILKVEGGWTLINHEQYRYSTEAKREFWRQQKQEQRRKLDEAKAKRLEAAQRKAEKKSGAGPLNGEIMSENKVKSGQWTQEQADEHAATTREKG